MNGLRNSTSWRSLPFWAASALILAVLVAAFALPTPPARADGPAPTSPVEIPCGERTPVIIVPAGTTLELAYFAGPTAVEDMDKYLADPALENDIWNAFLQRVREDENIGNWWVCQGCPNPNACVVWPVEISPFEQPEWTQYYYVDQYQVGEVWVVEMVIYYDLCVSSICTEC